MPVLEHPFRPFPSFPFPLHFAPRILPALPLGQ
jgi:hypothetical protein